MEKFPELPSGEEITAIFKTGSTSFDYQVAIVIKKHEVRLYQWDEVSPTFNRFDSFMRVPITHST